MGRQGDRVVAGLALAAACVVGLILLVTVFLGSAVGQRVDETALRGARIGRGHLIDGALTVLGLVSVVGLVVAICAVAVIAFSRRRVDLGIAVVVLVVGSNVTTQLLKTRVIERPTLGIHTLTLNSLPSGHSTVAGSLAVALVLVVPRALRGPLALFGAIAATLTGIATLAAGWHRPSDVVAAFFVVGAWLGLVTGALALFRRRRGATAPRTGSGSGSTWTMAILVAGGLVTLAVAGVTLWHTLGLPAIARTRSDLLIAYGGGASAVAGFAALLLVAALRVAPVGDPVPATTQVSPRRSARAP